MLHAAIVGLYSLQKARDETMRQFGIAQSLIQADDNSPFRICSDPDEAFIAMLGSLQARCKPTDTAVHLEFKRIVSHEMASYSAMFEMLEKLIVALDPKSLMRRVEGHSVLDSILPANREAKCWESYESLFRQQISLEVFCREFARAYEERIKKL
jgi:predicted component of type VI protein secretion system